MRSDADRLSDILNAAAKISERVTVNFDAFLADEMLQVWTIHHLQVIGEASSGVTLTLTERYTAVPWPQIVALRNILVHEYFGINLHQIWTMVQKDLPTLKEQIQKIRAEIS